MQVAIRMTMLLKMQGMLSTCWLCGILLQCGLSDSLLHSAVQGMQLHPLELSHLQQGCLKEVHTGTCEQVYNHLLCLMLLEPDIRVSMYAVCLTVVWAHNVV